MSKIAKSARPAEVPPLAEQAMPPGPPFVAEEPPLAEVPPLVRVRVLVDCALGRPDDVVEIDAALAETMAGVVDPAPAAVAYAESIKKA